MKKYFSLIRASMSEGMNLFKIKSKNKTGISKMILPIFLAFVLMGVMFSYSKSIMEQLQEVHMEFVLLTLFILLTSILTLIEGIYKSGSLLFKCKDDNLLLSLPIKKSVVLFIRILKFYVFELLYNSLFLLPSIIVYAMTVKVDVSYYIVSVIGLLLLPIIPILISCIIGTIITYASSKFKGKNIVQTILTIGLILGIMYFSTQMEDLFIKIANNASSINDFITKIYYPAGAFIDLVIDFKILKLVEFIIIHLVLLVLAILLIGKVYLKVNSGNKIIKKSKTIKEYKIKTSSPMKSLIKKEFNRFVNSPVFIINAGFGIVLFILGCISVVVKYDEAITKIFEFFPELTSDYIKEYIPIVLFALISCCSFMTSITSSMISLEGKSFNILKSLPIKPSKIIQSKIFAAILIMIPFMIIGDIIVFVKFNFNILSIILCFMASILFPLLSETIGILVNLKYPRMDAQNDTEVVKQSMSSAISVFIGMVLAGLTVYLITKALTANISINAILACFIGGYGIVYLILLLILHKTADKSFNDIVV